MSSSGTIAINCTSGVDGLGCYEVITAQQLAESLWLSAAGGALCIVVFIAMRSSSSWRPILHKRATQISDILFRPPPMNCTGFHRLVSWLTPTLCMSDADILATAGLDPLILIRFIQLGIQIFLPCSVLSCCVLVPLYSSSDALTTSNQGQNLDTMMLRTLSNIPKGSQLVWVTWSVMLICTCWSLWCLWMHCQSFAALRMLFIELQEFAGDMPSTLFQEDEDQEEKFVRSYAPQEAGLTQISGWRSYGFETPRASIALWFRKAGNTLWRAINPHAMTKADVEMVERCLKRLEIRLIQKIEKVSVDDEYEALRGQDWGPEVNSEVIEIPEAVCPYWLPTERTPAPINHALMGGGAVLLGKTSPNLRARVMGVRGKVHVWAPAASYVVLYRSIGPLPKNQWGKYLDINYQLATKHGAIESGIIDDTEEQLKKHSTAKEILEYNLRHLYPNTFQELVRVYNHKATERAVDEWDHAAAELEAVKAELQKIKQLENESSEKNSKLTLKLGAKTIERREARKLKLQEKLPILTELVARCEVRVIEERKKALDNPLDTAYFAIFTSQRDALEACYGNIGATPATGLKSEMAPGPDEINWQGLWSDFAQMMTRSIFYCTIPMIFVIIFPIGGITGALSNMEIALCGGNSTTNGLYWAWFCQSNWFFKFIMTVIVPVSISTFWDTWVMPMVLYVLCQAQHIYPSFTSLEKGIIRGFYAFSLLNTFIGAVLGGSIVQQLGALITTGKFFDLMGTALPAASNFFLNYIGVHALFTNLFRFIWPHDGTILFVFFRFFGLCRPRSQRDEWIIRSTPSYRSGRHYGAFIAIYIMAMSYMTVAPLILPLTVAYCLTAFISWRYSSIHFYQACYDGGGQLFEMNYRLMLTTVGVANLFTACVLFTKGLFIIGGSLVLAAALIIAAFANYCELHLLMYLRSVPIQVTAFAPSASVPKETYMPAVLRRGAVGWFPEHGKIWEKYGIPKFV